MASAVFKTVARPHERSRVGSTPMHSRHPGTRRMADPPPIHVLAAFAASRLVEPLEGGQGDSFRAGGIVLKRTGDPIEARWIGELFATLGGPGFRVPRSVRTRDGDWLADGWTAFEFVAAQTAGRNGGRWPETLAACRAFHAALCDVPRPAFIANATHAWAVADRLAWDELQIEPLAPYGDIIARLRRLLRPLDLPLQLVHGDFTANVLFAAGRPALRDRLLPLLAARALRPGRGHRGRHHLGRGRRVTGSELVRRRPGFRSAPRPGDPQACL